MAAAGAWSIPALGQTSGTWIPTPSASTDWNTPSQWIGAVPDGGGVATFNENYPAASLLDPTINTGVSLSQINFNSVSPYGITGAGGIALPAGGGTVNVIGSKANFLINPLSNSASSYAFNGGSTIATVLSGGPLTVTGTGAVSLAAANTYVGGTTINNATLSIASASALGSAAGPVQLNSGTLAVTSAATINQPLVVSGISALQAGAALTYSGVVSGTGTLVQNNYSVAGITFTASNTFSGAVVQAAQTSGISTDGITITGTGTMTGVTSWNIAGFLQIVNPSGQSINDRIGDSATISLAGGTLRMSNALGSGNTSTSTMEVAGSLNVWSGYSYLTLANVVASYPNPGTQLGLTVNSVTRSDGGLLIVRGNVLTDTAPTTGSGIASFISTTAPAGLTGGTGAAGTPDLKIIPWMFAAASSTAGATSVTFATWNASDGAIRPLAFSEVASSFGADATSNVQLSAGTTTLSGSVTANSLTISGAETINGPGPINITSGGLLVKSTSTINAPLSFPSGAEGVLAFAASVTTSNVISGTGGVTKGFSGTWTISGAGLSSTYSGATTITAGTVNVAGNLPVDANSPLGNTSAPVILNGGEQAGATLNFSANSIVDRDIVSAGGSPTSWLNMISTGGSQSLTFNGSVTLNQSVFFDTGVSPLVAGAPAAPTKINGVVSGPGLINLGFFQAPFISSVILNGPNTFSGGIVDRYGQVYAGSDSALGTGTYYAMARSGAFDLHSYPTLGATSGPSGTDTLRTLPNNLLLNSNGLTLNNAIPLKLTGAVNLNGNDTTLVALGSPTEIAGPITAGSLTVLGGSPVTLSGSNSFYGGITFGGASAEFGLTVGSATTLPDSSQVAAGQVIFASPGAFPAFASLTVEQGATATAADHGANPKNNLFVSGLTVAGTLDLANNDMVVRGSTEAAVDALVQSGALISSKAGTSGNDLLAGLAVVLNDNGAGGPLYSSFDGEPVVSTDVLVKYTYVGDTDLKGFVDANDLANLLAGMNGGLTGYENGDLNYDGVVNSTDLALLLASLSGQGAPFDGPGGGGGSVPEPSAALVAALAGMPLLGRRRRGLV